MSSRSSPRKRASPSSLAGLASGKAKKIARADGSPGTLGALFRKTKAEQQSTVGPETSGEAALFDSPVSAAAAAASSEDAPDSSPVSATDAPAKTDVGAASAAVPSRPVLTDAEESELKAFDLTMKYGPCAGLSRIARWNRAHKFGLEPPARIMEILEGRENEPTSNQSLFTKLQV